MYLDDIRSELIELAQLGQNLPIGIWTGERWLRSYTIKEYTGKDDERLGRLEDAAGDKPDRHERVLGSLLPPLIESIEGYSLEEVCAMMGGISKSRFVSELFLADAISIALNLRLMSYGWELLIGGTCPCERRIPLGRTEDGYHDLRTVQIRQIINLETEPVFTCQLVEPLGDIDQIRLFPPRLHQIPMLAEANYPLALRLLFNCSNITPEIFSEARGATLKQLAEVALNLQFGPHDSIEMSCPKCEREWLGGLEYGINYEDFYLSLIGAPRQDDSPGSTTKYLDEVAFALMFGKQAPFSSREDVLNLVPQSRNWWLNKVRTTLEQQADEMKKAQSKAKSGRKR